MDPLVNFVKFKRSNKPLHEGDVFTYQMPTEKFLFGRVALAKYPGGPMATGSLLYFYAQQSDTPEPDYAKMTINDLLIEPVWTNRLGWARGHFRTIANRPFEDGELPKVHCFHDVVWNRFVDLNRQKLPQRFEPCGEWSLASYRWIDDHVSHALGIPRVPVTDED